MAPDRRFLVLHGWQNRRPKGHWQFELVHDLRSRGERVRYPQFPDADLPDLDLWTELLLAELDQLGSGERVVIAHSLAVLLWMQVADSLSADRHADRVLLVAPPSPRVLAGIPEIAPFGGVQHDQMAIRRAAGSTRLVAADDDPYCPEGIDAAYGSLRLDTDVISGGRHLDLDAGYGEWPSALAWCLDPDVRLAARGPTR